MFLHLHLITFLMKYPVTECLEGAMARFCDTVVFYSAFVDLGLWCCEESVRHNYKITLMWSNPRIPAEESIRLKR